MVIPPCSPASITACFYNEAKIRTAGFPDFPDDIRIEPALFSGFPPYSWFYIGGGGQKLLAHVISAGVKFHSVEAPPSAP